MSARIETEFNRPYRLAVEYVSLPALLAFTALRLSYGEAASIHVGEHYEREMRKGSLGIYYRLRW